MPLCLEDCKCVQWPLGWPCFVEGPPRYGAFYVQKKRISLYNPREFGILGKEFRKEGNYLTEVVAALICQGDKFMICQRPAHKTRGLLWEFVGGKVEPGETREQALIRECREELAVTVTVGDVFFEVTHAYPDLAVHLILFRAAIVAGVPQKLEHNDIRWITAAEIPQYKFCPADEPILQKLRMD